MPDIELKKIQPNRLNPRLQFSKLGLDELADSIREMGIVEPIIVRPTDDSYQVVVGERRYRAAQQAGLDVVPAIIRDYTDDEVIELNLIENIHREDLSHVEKGQCCIDLLKKFPSKFPSQVELARMLSVDRSAVGAWVQSAEIISKPVQKMISPAEPSSGKVPKGSISGDLAVTLARNIKNEARQLELAQEITKRSIPKPHARKVISVAARQPQKPILEVIKETIEEAPVLLPFSKKHADDILATKKTQTSRKGTYPNIKPGRIVRAAITHFADLEIAQVYRKRLGDFDEEDAQREGGYTLAQFKEVWKGLHGVWNPNETVTVIRFRLSKLVEE